MVMEKALAEEIKRQYDRTLNRADVIDTKAGLILGFLFIAIGLTIDQNFITLVIQSETVSILFVVGLILVVISVVAGIASISFRAFDSGPRLSELLLIEKVPADQREDWLNGFEDWISRELQKDNVINDSVVVNKAQYAKVMFITFPIGLLLIIVLKVGCLGKLWWFRMKDKKGDKDKIPHDTGPRAAPDEPAKPAIPKNTGQVALQEMAQLIKDLRVEDVGQDTGDKAAKKLEPLLKDLYCIDISHDWGNRAPNVAVSDIDHDPGVRGPNVAVSDIGHDLRQRKWDPEKFQQLISHSAIYGLAVAQSHLEGGPSYNLSKSVPNVPPKLLRLMTDLSNE
jgi:hypothetical protein